MQKLNNLSKFLLGFIVVYAFLSAIHFTQPVKKAHVAFFITFEQFVFNMFHPNTRTDFQFYQGPPNPNNAGETFDFSIMIYTKNQWRKARLYPATPPNVQLNQTVKLTSIGPMTLFLSLLLISPIHWKRKLVAFFSGSFLIFVCIALKFSYLFQANDTMFALDNFSLWGMLTNLFGNAFRTHEFLLLCVVAIWAMVSFRLKDYKWFLE